MLAKEFWNKCTDGIFHDHDRMKIVFLDDNEELVDLPAKYEVCGTCGGRGKHVNRAIDGNGITASEMEELGPDFREEYFSGVYDVCCEECQGRNVVLAVDEEHADAKLLKDYHDLIEANWAYEKMCADERRMGA